MKSAKEAYRELSRTEPSIPLFSRDWWLDAVAGPDGWEVVLVRNEDSILAAMPYVMRRRCGLRVVGQPPFTQRLGPWLRPDDSRPAQRLAKEKDWMQALIDQLPAFDHFSQNWHIGCTNWLPFRWNGFRQTTNYTYVLPELQDTGRLWSSFERNVRAHCTKARDTYGLVMRDDLPLEKFLVLNRMTFARQGLPMPYDEEVVRRLDAACAAHGCRRMCVAVDPEGRVHAGDYMVWDENSAYGLMTGSNPELRHSGAVSLCLWESIRHAARVTRRFDFSGSMIEPIERFFRGFGATQMPYFNISKTPSLLLRMRQLLSAPQKPQEKRSKPRSTIVIWLLAFLQIGSTLSMDAQ